MKNKIKLMILIMTKYKILNNQNMQNNSMMKFKYLSKEDLFIYINNLTYHQRNARAHNTPWLAILRPQCRSPWKIEGFFDLQILCDGDFLIFEKFKFCPLMIFASQKSNQTNKQTKIFTNEWKRLSKVRNN